MSLNLHRRAEELMAEADLALDENRSEDATRLHAQAAQLEAQALRTIPPDRRRTRGIVAVSAVALFRKAGLLDEARRHAHEYLLSDLPDFAREQLEEMLFATSRELQARRDGRMLGQHGFTIFLRGENIRSGLAPIASVVAKLQTLESYVYRVTEWLGHRTFREHGPPRVEVVRLCQPLMSEPTIGSFRFDLRLEGYAQLSFFDEQPAPGPEMVAGELYSIINQVLEGDRESLAVRVSDERYRDVFLKLTRALVPDGKTLDEVEIRRTGVARPSSAVLTAEMRIIVQAQIESTLPPNLSESFVVGILRGLHLDRNYLYLVNDDGREQRCLLERDRIFDDVVGPLVAKRVRATGYWTKRHGKLQFVVADVEEEVAEGDPG